MADPIWEPTEDDFPKRWRMTDEQLHLLYHMMDTTRDTTMDGRPRCDYRYKGIDDFDQVVWMRCTEAARLRVLITEEGEPYWALVCYGCCPHSDHPRQVALHGSPLQPNKEDLSKDR
jgi:hypothetical protein